ncbi:hypothetical protein PROSTU_03726 [Providencia stuartii ATCC 25827]|uniref:Uncharacterized protein n=1 Tax=Providencia stuartii ATCC 25827 TaxID=471874 RepID=A0AA86Z1D7_PROST|nr:hypothetical protein PROSTU_03726 [Providencia stuartii ATCC 25827]
MVKAGKIAIKTNFGCSAQCGIGAVGAMDGNPPVFNRGYK